MSENVNITQLPLTTSMQNTDTMVVISDGKAKRFSYGNLAGNLNDWSSITNKVFDTYDKEYFNTYLSEANNISQNVLTFKPDSLNTHINGLIQEGVWNVLTSGNGIAIGKDTVASGDYSFAEGQNTTASGIGSHAEGCKTTSSGNGSHAEGVNTQAIGDGSHSGGENSVASGVSSFAHGIGTIANHNGEVAFGSYNQSNEKTIFSVGNGTAEARSNIFEVDSDGNVYAKKFIGETTSGTTISDWTANTDYEVGNLVINGNTLYKCINSHTSDESFDETESVNWTVLSGEQGVKGNDGVSPIATVESTDTGCIVTVIDASGTTTANLTNGTDGNDGVSPIVNVTPTENGCTVTVTDNSGTTSADLSNGVTPHIDETTKHWFIRDVDTGIMAEGVTTISTTSVIYMGTLSVDGWVGDTAPYTQDVEISGITAELSPFIDLIVSDDITTSDEEITQWSYITKATTGDNIITFRCNKTKPTIELNFKVKVV